MTVLQSYSLVLIKSILCIVSKASWRILYKEIGNRNITPFFILRIAFRVRS